MNKLLVLFSGTGSGERTCKDYNYECRGVEIVSKYNPYYNVDILKWDYKNELKEWIPDVIHSSPVCKEYSRLKQDKNRDLTLGNNLFDKSIEIIKYCLKLNPNLIYTIENPKNKFFLNKINKSLNNPIIHLTSYCKYGFKYKKDTYIVSNVKLFIKHHCCSKNKCKMVKEDGCHYVRIGVSRKSKTHFLTNDKQIPDSEYYRYIRDNIMLKEERRIIYNNQSLRYRIPQLLIEDIIWSIKNKLL